MGRCRFRRPIRNNMNNMNMNMNMNMNNMNINMKIFILFVFLILSSLYQIKNSTSSTLNLNYWMVEQQQLIVVTLPVEEVVDQLQVEEVVVEQQISNKSNSSNNDISSNDNDISSNNDNISNDNNENDNITISFASAAISSSYPTIPTIINNINGNNTNTNTNKTTELNKEIVPSSSITTTTTTDAATATATATALTSTTTENQNNENNENNNDESNNENENNDIIKRGIFLISMGKKACNTKLVERFIWSARNIGNYTGYIILLTDANKQRYEYESTPEPESTEPEHEPDDLQHIYATSINNSSKNNNNKMNNNNNKNNNNNNNKNNNNILKNDQKIIVFYPDKNIDIKHKRFKSYTMNSKVYKTYILDYIKKDIRLNNIELIYYLDIDIIFGNIIKPLFNEYENIYQIITQQSQQQSQQSHSSSFFLNGKTKSRTKTTKETRSAKIYFFEGNGSQEIQGGQFILRVIPSSLSSSKQQRNNSNNNNKLISSELCLERWRELMQKNVTDRYLKDQVSLTAMLDEQRQRQEKLLLQQSSASSSSSDTGKEEVEGKGRRRRRRGNKNSKIECEIVLMKQNKKYIQFPEVINITQRYNEIMQQKERREEYEYEYATLVHFRNSAHVMKDVDDKQLQYYIKDILRFNNTIDNTNNNDTTNNDDPYGFASKMTFNK